MRNPGLSAAMIAALTSAAISGAAQAEVPVEVSEINGARVTFYVHPFLDETELSTLRLVATQEQALRLFITSDKGFAAIALSPDEGFIEGGVPPASATAVAELPDAASAAAKALEMCNAARKGPAECVIVMEIAPPA